MGMKNYTPCQKHELLGCYTCNRKPQLPTITRVDYSMIEQFKRAEGFTPRCSFCRSDIEHADVVTRYQGKVVHVYCLTDVGESSFHTYENSTTQHSQHDIDPTYHRLRPTFAERGIEPDEPREDN